MRQQLASELVGKSAFIDLFKFSHSQALSLILKEANCAQPWRLAYVSE